MMVPAKMGCALAGLLIYRLASRCSHPLACYVCEKFPFMHSRKPHLSSKHG